MWSAYPRLSGPAAKAILSKPAIIVQFPNILERRGPAARVKRHRKFEIFIKWFDTLLTTLLGSQSVDIPSGEIRIEVALQCTDHGDDANQTNPATQQEETNSHSRQILLQDHQF